jgi:N utilization substance protein B
MTASAERRATPRPAKDVRRRAREAAVQMLYQWEIGRTPINEVLESFWLYHHAADESLPDALRALADSLAAGVTEQLANIDPMIAEAAEHWRLERMNVLDRLILRMAVYELLYHPDTPARVIINEALELARTFSNDDAVRFVNGVLDAIRRRFERE